MHVAEYGEAFWLLDAIASHEEKNPDLIAACEYERVDYLHFWRLDVTRKPGEQMGRARLWCEAEAGEPPIVEQEIELTDFPLDNLTVYAGNDGPGTLRKLFLPSEY